ncbi:hypothetical protein MAR_001169 [Mya arenaria]|uniref:DDE-1 domain-containing protein n=1 Tax=Mya arenaria TaxID=6604 RepID=A0ABY7FJ98_MYAAR|nr:hypothetical protein MAR_001169 [Mya arenaria]
MDDAIGERWFDEVFLKFCEPKRPQLLILDGHSSHETLGILMRAIENVHILSLPPHTTHMLQPLDKSVFGPVNRKYNQVCSEFLQENPLHQSGFKACGIYPLDADVIPDKAFGPSEPTDKPAVMLAVPTTDHGGPQISGDACSMSLCNTTVASAPSESTPEQSAMPDMPLEDQSLLPIGTDPSTDNGLASDHYLETSVSSVDDLSETRTAVDNLLASCGMMNVTGESLVLSPTKQTQENGLNDLLDISDTLQLSSLLSDKDVIVQPLIDENGNQIVLSFTEGTPKKATEIENEITNIFVPPSLQTP